MTKTKKPSAGEALEIEVVPVGDLVLDPSNVRLHPDKSIEAIKGSLARFGQQKPIVVNGDGVVVAGNGTLAAARDLGWKSIAIVRTKLVGTDAVAFAIADNRTAEMSDWDQDALAKVVAQIKDEDEDLAGALGFDEASMAGLVARAGGPLEEVEEDLTPPDDPHSKLGDLWICGDEATGHRVLCGDSTNADEVAALLDGAKPRLMVTDPPYGVEYDPEWRNKTRRPDGTFYGASSLGEVQNDDRIDWREAWALFPGDVAYVWHSGRHCGLVATSLDVSGFEIRAQIIWVKSRLIISRGAYHGQHEPCWYSVRKGSKAYWIGDRKQSTAWQIQVTDDGDKNNHGTQKPLECMARPMRNHDAPEVYDPFLGSGTTLIAAELLGRRCFGMELSPAYVDVIVQRWQNRTGKRATHAVTGEPFPTPQE